MTPLVPFTPEVPDVPSLPMILYATKLFSKIVSYPDIGSIGVLHGVYLIGTLIVMSACHPFTLSSVPSTTGFIMILPSNERFIST